jgi:hypothetical protein
MLYNPFELLLVFALCPDFSSFTQFAGFEKPASLSFEKRVFMEERRGGINPIRKDFSGRGPILDLMSSIFAIAEITMDSSSADVLAEHKELGFFEKEALAKLVIDETKKFHQTLPKVEVAWQLGIMKVHVKNDSGRVVKKQVRPERFVILKGDLTARYKKVEADDHQGVLVFWVEESAAAQGPPPRISAAISLTFLAFDKGEYLQKTKMIQVKHKEQERWDLTGN